MTGNEYQILYTRPSRKVTNHQFSSNVRSCSKIYHWNFLVPKHFVYDTHNTVVATSIGILKYSLNSLQFNFEDKNLFYLISWIKIILFKPFLFSKTNRKIKKRKVYPWINSKCFSRRNNTSRKMLYINSLKLFKGFV